MCACVCVCVRVRVRVHVRVRVRVCVCVCVCVAYTANSCKRSMITTTLINTWPRRVDSYFDLIYQDIAKIEKELRSRGSDMTQLRDEVAVVLRY